MKLKFYKEEDNDYVKIVTQDGKELEFDYIEMIKYIFNDKKIEEADIDDQYSEEEKASIRTLISDISSAIETLFSNDITGENKDESILIGDLSINS